MLRTQADYISTLSCAILNEWLTFYSTILNVRQSDVLTTLFDCYVAGDTWNCCRPGARSVYIIQPCTSLQCHLIPSHIRTVQVSLGVFRCNPPPALLAEWPGSLTCYCGITGVERIPIRESAQKFTLEKTTTTKISRRFCRDLNPRTFNHASGALITELFPLFKHARARVCVVCVRVHVCVCACMSTCALVCVC